MGFQTSTIYFLALSSYLLLVLLLSISRKPSVPKGIYLILIFYYVITCVTIYPLEVYKISTLTDFLNDVSWAIFLFSFGPFLFNYFRAYKKRVDSVFLNFKVGGQYLLISYIPSIVALCYMDEGTSLLSALFSITAAQILLVVNSQPVKVANLQPWAKAIQ